MLSVDFVIAVRYLRYSALFLRTPVVFIFNLRVSHTHLQVCVDVFLQFFHFVSTAVQNSTRSSEGLQFTGSPFKP